MKLFPKTITGPLHNQNKWACDWGWQGLMAYGCQNFVTVVDPRSIQVIQVLDKHRSTVTQVRWAHENYHHNVSSPYSLRLASSDSSGVIVVWDVSRGSCRACFSDGGKAVQAFEWLRNQDASRDLLIVLHPPYSLVLWNADTGTRLWRKSYTEAFHSFSIDPFNGKNLAFLGQECIVFIDDFVITKTPSSNGKKFYLSSSLNQRMSPVVSSSSLDKKGLTLAKIMSQILIGEAKHRAVDVAEEVAALNDCIQLDFHKSCRHHILLLYAREILILDLQINQTVGIVVMERTFSSFARVISCRQRDALICLHDDGSISVRARRRMNVVPSPARECHDNLSTKISLDVIYDLRCQTDQLRLTKQSRVCGVAMCPVLENKIALLITDSRLLLWKIQLVEQPHTNTSPLMHSQVCSNTIGIHKSDVAHSSIPIVRPVAPPILALSDMLPVTMPGSDGHQPNLRLLQSGLLSGLFGSITVARMCPPLTNKNSDIYEPLMALGSNSGSIQLVDVCSGQIVKEYNVHTSPVRGIEWTSLKSCLSYAFPTPGASGLVRNELVHVDTVSGQQKVLRFRPDDEMPIEQFQVSYLRQYFILTFKDKPLELWDLHTQTIIRELPQSFPRPIAVAWATSHSPKSYKKKLLDSHSVGSSSSTPTLTQSADTGIPGDQQFHGDMSDSSSGKEVKGCSRLSVREHFIMTDKDGTIFHFIVQGSAISDVTKIPAESGLSRVTSLAWKGDFIVFGDVEGVQCVWDLRAKISRTTPTSRGWVRKIRFAPGRENFRFLTMHSDGVLIWEIGADGKSEIQNSIKSPKDIAKVMDGDWAGSDRPALAAVDSLHIMDLDMRSTSSAIDSRELLYPIVCPYLLSAKSAMLAKCLLQHQPWNESFAFHVDLGLSGDNTEPWADVNSFLQLLDGSLLAYIPRCQFGVAERCLLAARLFGDESEIQFWTVALHYLRINLAVPSWQETDGPVTQGAQSWAEESSDRSVTGVTTGDADYEERLSLLLDQPLDTCFDFLCDNHTYKRYQLNRALLHDSKRVTSEQTQTCAEDCIMLGQIDRAVQLLLETEPCSSSYYLDCLRACLVTSVQSTGASQSTTKLVATNLIANGRLSEGVQLLCVIDKGADACRYLQTYGSWHRAVWLAKCTLTFGEASQVLRRWSDHLCTAQVNAKAVALLVLLSLGRFRKVVEMLYGMRHFDRAALFLEACLQFGAVSQTDDNRALTEAVFLEYARFLMNIGHGRAASYYCSLAGEMGSQLNQEVGILYSDD